MLIEDWIMLRSQNLTDFMNNELHSDTYYNYNHEKEAKWPYFLLLISTYV